MFSEHEITPTLLKEFQSQGIIIAHSWGEAYQEEIRSGNKLLAVGLAASRLNRILEKWKGHDATWSVIKGMRVLDLASGSGYSRSPWSKRVWYPQFARLCAVNGAEIVAIDVNPQQGLDRQLFTWAAEDLVDVVLKQGLPNLPILQNRKFDLIHSADFIGSNHCPELDDQLSHHGVSFNEYVRRFTDQAGKLLVNGGIMFLGFLDEKYDPILLTRNAQDVAELAS